MINIIISASVVVIVMIMDNIMTITFIILMCLYVRVDAACI